MKLTRLQLNQVRRFRDGLVLDELQPGLNVIYGPNEAGKSTVARALRAAFLERYKTRTVEDLRPWGDSSAAPEIIVDFVWQEQTWSLSKRFLQNPRSDLSINGKTFDGAEADDQLSQLLGYEYSGRGASRSSLWGIPGLLWVEQGQTHEIREPASHASEYLRSALGAELGAMASSTGDTILEEVAKRHSELFKADGSPRGAWDAAQKAWQASGAKVQELDTQIQRYRAEVDQLSELRRQNAQDRTTLPWVGMREQQQEAQARLDEVQGWQSQLGHDEQALQTRLSRLELVEQQLAAQRKFELEREQRQAEVSRSRETLADYRQRYARHEQERQAAEALHRQARQLVETLRQQLDAQRERSNLVQLRQREQELLLHVHEVQALQQAVLQLRAQLQTMAMDEQAFKALEKLARQLDDLALQQSLSATRLRYLLPEGCTLQSEGLTLNGEGEQELLRATQFVLPGGGSLEIIPGGTDLGELEQQAEKLSAAWQQACKQYQVNSLTEARAVLEHKRQLNSELQNHTTLLKARAPHGPQALAEELATVQLQISQLEQRFSTLELADAKNTVSEHDLSTADAAANRAELEWQEALKTCHATETELARAQLAAQQAEQEWAGLQTRAPLAPEAQLELRQESAALQVDIANRKAQLATQRERIAAARPDILRQDVERLGKSAEQLEKQFRERELQLVELQARLQTLSAEGLEEQRAERLSEYEHWEQRVTQLRQHAQALDLLLKTLQHHRQQLTSRLQAPLQAHLQRYLNLWRDGTQIALDEALLPQEVVRRHDRQTEQSQLEDLSHGAREQLGLIVRLAYADLLREAGRPTLLLLDDALTHSDARRLEAMKRILFDAGQRHQILILTCHPQAWQDLGVTPRDINQLPRLI